MSATIHTFTRPAATLPMPEAIEAEQAVLGAVLCWNSTLAAVAPHVDVADCGEPIHQRIFDVASQLIAAGKPASPITLKTFLGDAELAEGVTMGAFLARLAAGALPPSEAPGMAKHVRGVAARRRLIAAAAALDERVRDAAVRDDPAEIAGDAMLGLQDIAATAGTDTARPIAGFADHLMSEVEGVLAGSVMPRIITTGYVDLDRAMNGLDPGTLVLAAGRPGMGKTMLANSIGHRCARTGVGVLEFPLEIGTGQMTARHLADIAYRGAGRSPAFRDIGKRAGEMTEGQVQAVREACARLRELPIVMDSRSRVTVPQISAKVAQVQRDMRSRGVELGLVVLDHLDFIAASDRYRGIRVQEVGEIVLGLKDVARSQGVCVLLMSQLSREVEKRSAKERRPTLADLRNSGDLEQVADVVAFLYREEYYLTRSPGYLAGDPAALDAALAAQGKLEVILAKVRAGPTPTIHLWCDPASSSISSFERGRP